MWWYVFAKVIDLFDTVFFVMRKKQNQITFLHVYHHASVLLGAWLFLKYLPGESNRWTAIKHQSANARSINGLSDLLNLNYNFIWSLFFFFRWTRNCYWIFKLFCPHHYVLLLFGSSIGSPIPKIHLVEKVYDKDTIGTIYNHFMLFGGAILYGL